jgi:UDP-N-acetylglucosamine acyltransferase
MRSMVHPDAKLAPDVEVGPFCTIGAGVTIGAGSKLVSPCDRWPHHHRWRQCLLSVLLDWSGLTGQEVRQRTDSAVIGDSNVFRENCTVHRGTVQDKGLTSIGSRGLFMASAHVAHDCVVGDDVILANAATLGGHVRVGNWAILGGLAGVHQFCRVGEHAMVGGASCVLQDVAPYVLGQGNPFSLSTVNAEGLKRRGFSPEAIAAVRNAYKTVFRNNLTLKEAIAVLEAEQGTASDVVPRCIRC